MNKLAAVILNGKFIKLSISRRDARDRTMLMFLAGAGAGGLGGLARKVTDGEVNEHWLPASLLAGGLAGKMGSNVGQFVNISRNSPEYLPDQGDPAEVSAYNRQVDAVNNAALKYQTLGALAGGALTGYYVSNPGWGTKR